MEFVQRSRSESGFCEEEQQELIGESSGNNTKQPFSSSPSPSSQYESVVRQEHHQHHQEQQILTSNEVVFIEREHMFDKVVTPSDVGKLNRLVIPKQYAERYFPLDSTSNEKGLLLNFEDRSGKPWRFRYSYWNSSQSYVMTKGWSRFVKEKKLDAGDIVSFERGAGELVKDRLFIDWRRRPNAPDLTSLSLHPDLMSLPRRVVPFGRLFFPQAGSGTMSAGSSMPREHFQLNYEQQQHYHHLLQQQHQHQYQHQHQHVSSTSSPSFYGGYNNMVTNNPGSSVFYLRSSSSATTPQQVGEDSSPIVFDSVPVVHGKTAAKRVRLFGVNLECPISTEDNPHECDFMSSKTNIPMNTTIESSSSSSSSLPHNSHMMNWNNSNPSHHPLQLRVYNGAPLPTMPTELSKRGRQSLSFDLDI